MNSIQEHLKTMLTTEQRLGGRKLQEWRAITIEKNLVKTAEGSARVRFGESEVIAGVKLSIGEPFPDTPDDGALMANMELIPLANPEFESGPPGIDAIEISRQVDKVVRESGIIDMSKLCIEKGKKVWVVSIDVIPINADGNLIDLATLASIAALQNTFFPKVDGEGKVDYTEKTKKALELENLALAVTVFKIGTKYIVDPDYEEEKVADTRITFGILDDDTLCSIQKGGTTPVMSEDVEEMVTLAIEKAQGLRERLGKATKAKDD